MLYYRTVPVQSHFIYFNLELAVRERGELRVVVYNDIVRAGQWAGACVSPGESRCGRAGTSRQWLGA